MQQNSVSPKCLHVSLLTHSASFVHGIGEVFWDGQVYVGSREPQTLGEAAYALVNNSFPMISGLAWETSESSAKLLLNTTAGLYHTQGLCGLWRLSFMLVWNLDVGKHLKAKVQRQP